MSPSLVLSIPVARLARLAGICGTLLLLGPGTVPAAAQQTRLLAKCGEFYDKWDAPGAPRNTLIIAGLGHEVTAARDCVATNKLPTACEHYKRVLTALDRIGPDFAQENRADVQALMRQANCT